MKRMKEGKKQVTMDDLARMVQKGFLETKVNIQGVESRLGKVEGRLGKVEERLMTVEAKLDRTLYTEYVHLERRVNRIEQKIGLRHTPA